MPVRPSIRKDSHWSWTLTFNHKLPLRRRYKYASFNKGALPRNKTFFPNSKYLTMGKGQHSQPAAGKSWVDSQWRNTDTPDRQGHTCCPGKARAVPEQPGLPLQGSVGHSWGRTAAHGVQVLPARAAPSPAATPSLPHPLICTMPPQQPRAIKKKQQGKYWGSFECFFSTVLMIKHSTTQNTGQLTESLLMAQQLITSILLDER